MFTAPSSFGLPFESTDVLTPLLMVVVAVNPCQAETFRMALALVLADLIFLTGKDVRIVIEYRRTDIMLHHPLHNSG